MFSIKLTNLWFFLLINTLAMQQHLAQLRHSYVADIRIEVSGISTLLHNEILLLHLTINHSIICIRQRLTQREDWLCEFLSICCSGNHLIPSDMSFPYDQFCCKIVMSDTHTRTDRHHVCNYI